MFLTFWGTPRGDQHAHDHAHESPKVMLVPLVVLAAGAVLSGMVWYGSFFGDHAKVNQFFGIPTHAEAAAEGTHEEAATAETDDHGHAAGPPQGAIFMAPDNHVMDEAHHAPTWVKVSPFVAMLLGLGVAIWFYILQPGLPARVAQSQRPLYLFLLNKWYIDELYDAVLINPTKRLARLLWRGGDLGIIDGFLNGVAMGIVPFFTRLAGRAQSGYIFTYAFAMVIGIVVLITWMVFAGGAE